MLLTIFEALASSTEQMHTTQVHDVLIAVMQAVQDLSACDYRLPPEIAGKTGVTGKIRNTHVKVFSNGNV